MATRLFQQRAGRFAGGLARKAPAITNPPSGTTRATASAAPGTRERANPIAVSGQTKWVIPAPAAARVIARCLEKWRSLNCARTFSC